MTIIPPRSYLTPFGRGLGARPSPPDPRDHAAAMPILRVVATYPAVASLRSMVTEKYNQGDLADCVQNSFASLYRIELRRLGLPDLRPDRLFLYYETRRVEGTTGQNTGTAPRDTLKVMQKTGVPPEADWPYDTSKFAQQPPPQAYADAPAHTFDSYAAVAQVLDAMRAQINAKKAFSVALNVFSSFEGSQAMQTGIVPMPNPSAEQLLGGHQMLGVGYDDNRQLVECLNSWGGDLGDAGFMWLPFAYVLNPKLCWEFWIATILAQVTPVPTPTTTTTPPPMPTPTTSKYKTTVYLNLRKGPGLNHEILGVIPPDNAVVGDGRTQQAGNYTWVHLVQTPLGESGWVAQDYLSPV